MGYESECKVIVCLGGASTGRSVTGANREQQLMLVTMILDYDAIAIIAIMIKIIDCSNDCDGNYTGVCDAVFDVEIMVVLDIWKMIQ